MAKAVLTHKPGSVYDDDPYERYHFPASYLGAIEAAVGDFIVYYEPGRRTVGDSDRSGRMAYFATARITSVEKDPAQEGFYYARIDSYLDFARPVPFREAGGTYERRLSKTDGSTNRGLAGRAVRLLQDEEFAAICAAGLTVGWEAVEPPVQASVGLAEAPAPFLGPEAEVHPIIERLVARPYRDAAFQRAVQEAYGKTCAFTGLKVINGGGRAEVEAAHIRPVAQHGPDTVRNGLALSRTVHWMFDRGLISVGEDHGLLVTGQGLPEPARRLFRPDGSLFLPDNPAFRPAPAFLRYHREHVFKP
ncbi:HNH endonuclease [Geminicoccaceae bacterium 1502E]|nr:HNH endonuclease [Geminicoccaceae bacterium 1502E]